MKCSVVVLISTLIAGSAFADVNKVTTITCGNITVQHASSGATVASVGKNNKWVKAKVHVNPTTGIYRYDFRIEGGESFYDGSDFKTYIADSQKYTLTFVPMDPTHSSLESSLRTCHGMGIDVLFCDTIGLGSYTSLPGETSISCSIN